VRRINYSNPITKFGILPMEIRVGKVWKRLKIYEEIIEFFYFRSLPLSLFLFWLFDPFTLMVAKLQFDIF